MELWIQRRYIKSPGRAIEKALTCYGGDVSRLVDICRGRIVFDGAAGMLSCVEAILAEAPWVKVVRIRNGMDPRHDPYATAGFRVRQHIHTFPTGLNLSALLFLSLFCCGNVRGSAWC